MRVSVNHLIDRLWRCSYSLSRRSRMTRWPTRLVRNVWTIPRPPVTTVMPAITPARIQSRSRSGVPAAGNSAESKTTRINTGLTTPSPAVTKMSRPTAATVGRYGLKVAAMRHTRPVRAELSGLSSFSTMPCGVVLLAGISRGKRSLAGLWGRHSQDPV